MFRRFSRRSSTGSPSKNPSFEEAEEVHAFVHDLKKSMGLTARDKTLVITKIERFGQADRGGVKVGDIVTSIGGTNVKNIGEIKSAIINCKNRGDREVVVCCQTGASARRQAWEKHENGQNKKIKGEITSIMSAAEHGDAVSQYKLGVAYSQGTLGLDQNDAEAVRWWNASVAQGYIAAQISLGIALYTGKVGNGARQVNYEGARTLWEAASLKGSAEAFTNLACMYLEGRGVTQDGEKAIEFLHQASSLGDVQADLILAIILEKGIKAAPKDIEKSNELFKKVDEAQTSKTENSQAILTKYRRATISTASPLTSPTIQGQGKIASLSFRNDDQSPDASRELRVSQIGQNGAKTEDGKVKKSGHLEARAAATAMNKEARAEKERQRQERIKHTADLVNAASTSKPEDEVVKPSPESAKQLKESMAEALHNIVYMNATVLFNVLDSSRSHVVSKTELANGFNKFTAYHVDEYNEYVIEILNELDVEGKGSISITDMKERWHVLAGGIPKKISAARRRASNSHQQNNL
mmetsp:Transcript_22948/g.26987  ORF Transcript_22948/g.26987 Transcript_22948/m.26987 type:complete len:526 (-) Transcript_22948:51-1628(-)